MSKLNTKTERGFAPIFVSHGAPTLPFDDVSARQFLKNLGSSMPKPEAILVVSAHWETQVPTVNSVVTNETIHDFWGFPDELYALRYAAPGHQGVAKKVASLLELAGLSPHIDGTRGLDHGAWVPLMLAWPEANIPVLQLSVQTHLGPIHHYEMGKALRSLSSENILMLASGSYTHDLSSWRGQEGMPEPKWVSEFADWFDAQLSDGNIQSLLEYRDLAPFAARNHPTEEHLLPLFFALGAAGDAPKSRKLHTSTTFGVLRMDAFEFTSS